MPARPEDLGIARARESKVQISNLSTEDINHALDQLQKFYETKLTSIENRIKVVENK